MSNVVTNKGCPITGTLAENVNPKAATLLKTFARPVTETLNADFYKNRVEDVSIGVLSLVNRDTEVKNIVRVIKETGGFDVSCWNRPKVARIQGTNLEYLFDGDHSRAIFKEFFPNQDTLPCDIIDVADKAEVHRLFIRYNAKCKTSIKAEEIFVHEYHAGDEDAQYIAEMLAGAGLQVYCSHEPGGAVGDVDGMRVKIGAAKKAFNLQALVRSVNPKLGYGAAVADAAEMLRSAGLTPSREDMVPGELLCALTIILSLNPTLRENKGDGAIFRAWIRGKLSNDTVRQVAQTFQSEGGSIVNHQEYSVAVGIIKGLQQQPSPKSLQGLEHCYDTRLVTRYFGPGKKMASKWKKVNGRKPIKA